MITILAGSAVFLLLWILLRRGSSINNPSEYTQLQNQYATEDEIRRFFANTSNFVNVPIEDIFAILGRPLEYDDWDWGRLAYEWKRPTLRMRMIARGGVAMYVAELDPQDTSRYGATLVEIWGDPSP
jgi:hypothetical protein